jgi:two-component system, chemotaxis family, chemotaxis protein CheY
MNANILIVDDSSLTRRTLRGLLEEMGHKVDDASDGTQALEAYFLRKPDIVILDMVMQGMYGTEVLAKIREMNPDARVIVATADIQTSTAEQVKAAGAAAILNKPINKAKLTETLNTVLAGGTTWN